MARPGIGAAARLPIAGHMVDLGCANPANIGLTAAVLKAADPQAGGKLRCFARAIGRQGKSGPQIMAGPVGLGPSQIQSAYKLAGLSGGRTVAIVDAYNDPNAASDLATYRKAYGLPDCTTANGCFKQVNQSGATSPLPAGDYGWAEEESLDLDAVSAACPSCHILLVEANSAATTSISPRPGTPPPRRREWPPSPTATADPRIPRRPRTTATTTTRAWRSPSARATPATGWSTRRRRPT